MRAVIVLLLLCASCVAWAGHGSSPGIGQRVEVRVVDRDTGAVLPLHRHGGEFWIAGTPGHRYSVVLGNRTGRRLLAVLSVDGVNAVTGETAAGDQAGYVLAPWGRTEVTGWRKSLSDVAAFEFTALHDSYAARTGRPRNVGVIGVAVFEERYYRHHEHEEIAGLPYGGGDHYPDRRSDHRPAPKHAQRADADASTGASAPAEAPAPALQGEALADGAKAFGRLAPGEPLGTGHGGREWSAARHTRFERASTRPVELVAIRYDSERNLVAAGILPRWPRYGYRDPRPFPGEFVPDPW